MRELLRHPNYRLLLLGQTLSMFGDWTLLLVFGIWAKTLTGSNAVAGLTVLAMAAPGLLGPFAGLVVDRLPRRAVMIGLNLASAGAVSTLWLVRDRHQLWLLFAVAVWYGISTIMFNAALSGLVQGMLPPGQIGPANGVLATLRQALRLIGPIVGAGLFTTVGGRWVATLDAATFALSTLALLLITHPETATPQDRVSFWAELGAGLRHLWHHSQLRALSWATLVFSLAIGLIEPTVYALADGLHRSPAFVGVLVSVQGAGAIAGGIGISVLISRITETPLIITGLTLIAVGIGLCTLPTMSAALAGFILIGAGLPILTVAAATLLQHQTANHVMGRVAASYDTIGTVPTTASIATGALLVAIWPYQLILGLSAAGCGLAALLLLLMSTTPSETRTPTVSVAPHKAAEYAPATPPTP